MTQEQKDLLLKDLCSRLPYGVKGVNKAGIITDPSDWYCGFVRLSKELENRICYSDWRPYLFPLSSMTDEQKKEWNKWKHLVPVCHYEYGDIVEEDELWDSPASFLYLIENHFDCNDLIPLGLAVDATGKNIY